jgi:hypothetical protein
MTVLAVGDVVGAEAATWLAQRYAMTTESTGSS